MPEKEKTQIRIGGGRHPGMAQNVEKPKHAKDAAKRLLSYFGRDYVLRKVMLCSAA